MHIKNNVLHKEGISWEEQEEKPQISYAITAQTADTGSRIRVDINKNDGRKASYSKKRRQLVIGRRHITVL